MMTQTHHPPPEMPRSDELLHRIPHGPVDRIEDAVERARSAVRRTRLRALGSAVKAFTAACEEAAAAYQRHASDAARVNAERIGDDLDRRTEAALHESGGCENLVSELEAQRAGIIKAAAALRGCADLARAEREGAIGQANAVADEIGRRLRSAWRLFWYWFRRKTPNQMTTRQVEHLRRAERARHESIRADAGEELGRLIASHIDEAIDRYRKDRDGAASADQNATARRREAAEAARAATTVREIIGPEEAAEMIRPLCADQARVRAVAQRILRRHRAGEGSLPEIIGEESRREAAAAALPGGFNEAMMAIRPARRSTRFESMMTEAPAHLPIEWYEAPTDERHHWRFISVPGGEGAPYHDDLVSINPDQACTFTIDSSMEGQSEASVVDFEIGLAPCQVPWLVDARLSTPDERIKGAMLWDDPEQMYEVDYELQARRKDDDGASWRRLALGLALGALTLDDGRWYRTTDAALFNGMAECRIGQGVVSSVETLRSGDIARGLDVAIENRLAALGTDRAIEALEAAKNLPVAAQYADKVRQILAAEVVHLRRELLAA